MNKIVAVVGMCGSGKSVATELFEKYGYQKVYFGGITYDKMKELEKAISDKSVTSDEIERTSGKVMEEGILLYDNDEKGETKK